MWALAAWWNVGSEHAPYLVPFDAVRAMGEPASSVRRVLLLHALTADVNAALKSADRELTRRRQVLGLD